MTKGNGTREHEFTLTLGGVAEIDPTVMDGLFAAGCDDATAGVRFGCVYLSFVREAPTLRDALLSAIRDVPRAEIGATVVQADDCNMVGQAQ